VSDIDYDVEIIWEAGIDENNNPVNARFLGSAYLGYKIYEQE